MKSYRFALERFLSQTDLEAITSRDIEGYLLRIPTNDISLGNRHAHYRTLKTFFRWLESKYGISHKYELVQRETVSIIHLTD